MDWLVEKSYKLVSPAVEAAMRVKNKGKELIHKGKEKVVAAGGAAMSFAADLLGLRQNFKTEDGESHSLYFKGNDDRAELMVASTPMSYHEFLEGIDVQNASQAKKDAKEQALLLASAIAEEKARRYPEGLTDAQIQPLRRAKRQRVQILLTQLQNHSAILLMGTHAPTGLSKKDAIKFVWFKHPHYYDTKINLPRLGLTNIGKDDKVQLPLAPDGLTMTLGVNDRFWPRVGQKFQFIPESRGDKVPQFRDVLAYFGYNWSGLDADHVKDLKFEGQDHESNIWPMDNSANRSAGARQNNQIVIYKNERGQAVPINAGNMALIGRYFEIVAVQM